MKKSSIMAPLEICRVPEEYPIMIYVFHGTDIQKETVIARHWHTDLEMTYRIKYQGKIIINQKSYELTDHSLFIVNSKDVHEIHTYPQKEMLAILISFPYEFVKSFLPDADFYHFTVGTHEEQMKKIILEMKEVKEEKQPYSQIKIYSLTLELLYLLALDAKPKSSLFANDSPAKYREKKEEIMQYLDEQICTIHSTVELSSYFGYSREHFSRMVKTLFGISCKELIDRTRLAFAIRQIQNRRDPIGQIAEEAGFSGYRNFSMVCKKYYGMSPEQFCKK